MANADVIIAGGGLAGLVTGIGLARGGHRVLIIEKHRYPRHKVCGEYLSREVLPFLDSLGVTLPSGLPVISKLNLFIHDGKAIHTRLPLGGIGISRYALDHLLYQFAMEAGCEFVFDEVLQTEYSGDISTVCTKDGKSYNARLVMGSFGRHPLKNNPRIAVEPKKYIGVKAHYRVDIDPEAVGLYLFDGGYCGVSRVENGVANICYLASYESFGQHKSPEAFIREVLGRNNALAKLLQRAEPVFKPIAVSNITFEEKVRVDGGILMLGDAAQMIHPLSGNGMAMALGAAEIAIPLADAFLLGKMDRATLETTYDFEWKKKFAVRVATGRKIARVMLDRRLSKMGLRFLQMAPGILPRVVALTHGQPKPDFSRRSNRPEIMDDFFLEGEELRDALDKLAGINRFLGGNRLTLQGVACLTSGVDREVVIVDYGCGNGDMLRQVAKWGRKTGLMMRLVGIDANAFTINIAREQSREFPEIAFRCGDFLASEHQIDCDIALFTLTLHHFKDAEIVSTLEKAIKQTRLGIVVNDLHRSPMAYRLFKVVCAVFGLNRMSREDGLVSIQRGFTKKDLEHYCKKLNIKANIRWKWAFRYRWIIQNT